MIGHQLLNSEVLSCCDTRGPHLGGMVELTWVLLLVLTNTYLKKNYKLSKNKEIIHKHICHFFFRLIKEDMSLLSKSSCVFFCLQIVRLYNTLYLFIHYFLSASKP